RKLFVKKGFKGTTVRDIAAEAGTNVAMVNYYFQSKYNLFEHIFNEIFEVLTGRVFNILDSDLPFFEMVEQWISVYYETLFEYPEFPLFIINELSQQPDVLREKMESKQPYRIFLKLSERIKEEMRSGQVREVSLPDFALNTISLCMYPFIFSPVATAFLNISKEDYMELLKKHKKDVVEFVIHSLKNPDYKEK
ncbi:MAG: TetR/AcrR family transcriptional regulator, partial [Bacteroidales bacterium]|nr:TetR/AcrR family transcriptional regulator [Bacteroidales bacterium]